MITNIAAIQDHLQSERVDGWLLYGFRDQNPIALAVAGLQSAGSRRWFLWIPVKGELSWIVHTIERTTFLDLPPERQGNMFHYITWQEMQQRLEQVVRVAGMPANKNLFVRRYPGGVGGRIISGSSSQAGGPIPSELPYIPTKGAVEALTLSLSAAVPAKGMTVNAVDPRITDNGWISQKQKAFGAR